MRHRPSIISLILPLAIACATDTAPLATDTSASTTAADLSLPNGANLFRVPLDRICHVDPDGSVRAIEAQPRSARIHLDQHGDWPVEDELCGDAIDNDCDGAIDEDCPTSCPCLDELPAVMDSISWSSADISCHTEDHAETDGTLVFGTLSDPDTLYVELDSYRWETGEIDCTAYWSWRTADGESGVNGVETTLTAEEHDVCRAELAQLASDFDETCEPMASER